MQVLSGETCKRTTIGTLRYMAPEVLMGTGGLPADLWSLGMPCCTFPLCLVAPCCACMAPEVHNGTGGLPADLLGLGVQCKPNDEEL